MNRPFFIRGNLDHSVFDYKQDGTRYDTTPANVQHCFWADYDDTTEGGELEEELVVVCESTDRTTIRLYEPSLAVVSGEMVDAIYDETGQKRIFCGSGQRRVWKAGLTSDNTSTTPISEEISDSYLQKAYGTDLNRNFQFKWDVAQGQKHLFIRSRSPSSRIYRGTNLVSEKEISSMEDLIDSKNVVTLID